MEIKSNPEWNEKSPSEKRLNVAGIVIALIVLVLAGLQMSGVADNLTVIFAPLMGLLMLIQAMQMRNSKKAVAVLCVVIAVILFICSFILVMAAVGSGT